MTTVTTLSTICVYVNTYLLCYIYVFSIFHKLLLSEIPSKSSIIETKINQLHITHMFISISLMPLSQTTVTTNKEIWTPTIPCQVVCLLPTVGVRVMTRPVRDLSRWNGWIRFGGSKRRPRSGPGGSPRWDLCLYSKWWTRWSWTTWCWEVTWCRDSLPITDPWGWYIYLHLP